MATTAVGRTAESAVANSLANKGFKILTKNWRTRWCEIDIIAQKDDAVYFVEVKYRRSLSQGNGFEYIGPNKIRQLDFAADFWVSQNDWRGNYLLIGADVTGVDFDQIELVEIL